MSGHCAQNLPGLTASPVSTCLSACPLFCHGCWCWTISFHKKVRRSETALGGTLLPLPLICRSTGLRPHLQGPARRIQSNVVGSEFVMFMFPDDLYVYLFTEWTTIHDSTTVDTCVCELREHSRARCAQVGCLRAYPRHGHTLHTQSGVADPASMSETVAAALWRSGAPRNPVARATVLLRGLAERQSSEAQLHL